MSPFYSLNLFASLSLSLLWYICTAVCMPRQWYEPSVRMRLIENGNSIYVNRRTDRPMTTTTIFICVVLSYLFCVVRSFFVYLFSLSFPSVSCVVFSRLLLFFPYIYIINSSFRSMPCIECYYSFICCVVFFYLFFLLILLLYLVLLKISNHSHVCWIYISICALFLLLLICASEFKNKYTQKNPNQFFIRIELAM